MKYVGLGLWLKANLRLQDLLDVYDLGRLQYEAKGRMLRIRYQKRMLEILTTGKVRWYHVYLLTRVLVMHDLLGKEITEDKPHDSINHFVNWLSPRVGKTPEELLNNFNPDQLQNFSKQAIEYEYQNRLLLVTANHAPKQFFKDIEKMFEYKQAEQTIKRLGAKLAHIQEQTEATIDMMKQMFSGRPGAALVNKYANHENEEEDGGLDEDALV